MHTYTVTAERGTTTNRWVLQCVEHPGAISEASSLTAAPSQMREAIAFVAGCPVSDVQARVVPKLPASAQDVVEQARAAAVELARAQEAASHASRRAVRELVEVEGLSGRDAAIVLGLSPQRVSQLLHG